MKQQAKLLPVVLIAGLVLIAGCSAFKYGAPPTKLEQAAFNVQTNIITIPVLRTNWTVVTQTQTNIVPVLVTNPQNVTVTTYTTNVVPVIVQVPTVTMGTSNVTTYTYSPGPGVQTAAGVAGTIGNLFGVGGIASTALTAIAGLWAWYRGSKLKNTGGTLAQEIETIRAFVKLLPNGANYDTILTQWLSDHQKETGTVSQVLDLLQNVVSNPNAQIAAQQIQAAINALNPTAPKV